jgi:peptide/nickel transport system ATP-binding protein
LGGYGVKRLTDIFLAFPRLILAMALAAALGPGLENAVLAIALITDPEIILLDEPTSALDVSVQAEVLNLLMRLKREHGLAYILVSHNLAVTAHMCKTLSVMQNGSVVETMSVQQLRDHSPTMPYTKQLMTASLGYNRAAIDAFEEFA